MQELGLFSHRKRKFVVTTDSNHAYPVAENLLERDFHATAPNQKWLTDITYIATREGWLYLAAVLDVYSRRIVGWSASEWIDTELVKSALHMATMRSYKHRVDHRLFADYFVVRFSSPAIKTTAGLCHP